MVQFPMSIVTGCMESLDMKLLVRDTGHVGMEPPLSSCALEDCCITKLRTAVIGLRFVD